MKEICFCGSLAKFKKDFELLGKNPSFYIPDLEDKGRSTEEELLQQHFEKMLDSKKIVILMDGTIGETVAKELHFALEHKMWIELFNQHLQITVLEINKKT